MNKKILIAVFAFLLVIRIYPASINEYPKGSDSWYHLDRAYNILGGDLIYDRLNAGGSVSSYPPLFHAIIVPVFLFPEPLQVAKFLAVAISFLALIAFFLFAKKLVDKNVALAATFVFGTAVEIVNTAIFLSPENLGFLLMFLALYFSLTDKKTPFLAASILLALTHTLTFIVFLLLYSVLLEKNKIRLMLPSIVVFIAWISLAKISGAANLIIPGNSILIAQYFYGFSALFLALAIAGISSKNIRLTVLFVAMTAYAFLLPFYPERIFTFSIIPASVLAGIGFMKYWKAHDKEYIRYALVLVLIVAAFFALDYSYAKAEMTADDKAVLDWARDNTPAAATVASTWQVSGAWMPLLAERRNVLGAFQESVPDYGQRRADLDIIFTSENKDAVIEAMKKYNASYIFINHLEDDTLYKDSIKRLSSMFTEVKGNEYAHLYKI